MFARIARSLIAFGVVLVAYQVYALMLVPILTPHSVVRASGGSGMVRDSVNPVAKYQQLLASYFPAGHWSLTGKPIVIENGQLMLVLDKYVRDNTGRVDLSKCAVVIFPTQRTQAVPSPSDAVVIEPERGAKLKFDKDFNPSRGSIGRIEQGSFPGRITIRSGMREPGPADDLYIETRDLHMNSSGIFTLEDVVFRLGNNRGGGRQMVIHLIEEELRRPGEKSLGVSGVSDLEIFEDVKLSMQVGQLRLSDSLSALSPARRARPANIRLTSFEGGPVQDSGASAWADAPRGPSVYAHAIPRPQQQPKAQAVAPPLEVTCKGRFRLDFLEYTATFSNAVYARQLSLTGQSDQLTCEKLELRFEGDTPRPSADSDAEFGRKQRSALGGLRPTALRATGEPVRVDSPSRQAHARGSELVIELDKRQLMLSGGNPKLVQGGSEVNSPLIRYRHPAKGEPAAIGRLWLAGPGLLRITPKAENPQDALEARWNAVPGVEFPVQLTRDNNRPVLMVEGRPRLTSTAMGRITCDRLRLAMREVPADGRDGPAIEVGPASGDQLALLPERIDAVGAVRIESPELSAKTHQMVVWVRPEDHRPALGDPRGSGPRSSRSGTGVPQKTYRLSSQKMKMDLLLHGRRGVPANLVCEGEVRFEQDADATGKTPMSVTGERLKINNLTSGAVAVEVQGGQTPAVIVAQGVALRAAKVMLSQGENRLWADGAGSAKLSVKGDLFGQASRAASDMHLHWKGGLNFDGRTITVRDEVFVDGAHDWVRCETASATLTRAIDFANARGRMDIKIAELNCGGGVTVDHRTVDPQGQSSHERAKIETFTMNQTTGEISGTGPGWVRSVRLGSAGGGLLATSSPGRPKKEAKAGLQFLRVHFNRGVSGNMNRRELSFLGNVRAVYGPVGAWERELPLNHPNGLPADTAALRCDRLTVNEDPLHGTARVPPVPKEKGLGPVELHALGAVQIQGASEDKGLFTAYASAASYSQSKEQFVLEGDARKLATLFQQDAIGSSPRKSEAQKLTFWRLTRQVKIENFSHATGGPESAARPGAAPPRR